ncbi:hypothetical protein STEG23_000926 [Scotinomys teguina]
MDQVVFEGEIKREPQISDECPDKLQVSQSSHPLVTQAITVALGYPTELDVGDIGLTFLNQSKTQVSKFYTKIKENVKESPVKLNKLVQE